MSHFKLLRLLWLVLLPGGVALAQINVGNNGGEGVFKDGHLFVRDLYEEATHLNPYIGPRVDDCFRSLGVTGEKLRAMDVDLSLLRRKLTDLNEATPGLGLLVREALSHYRLSFAREPLPLLVPSLSADFERSRRKIDLRQLAIRRGMEIEFDRQNWRLLSPAHRVALLVHEAIFSMLRPIAFVVGDHSFFQVSAFVRPVVGQLFSSKELFRLNAGRVARQRLGLPTENFCKENALRIQMSFFPLGSEISRDIYFQLSFSDDGSRSAVLERVCRQAHEAGARHFKLNAQRTYWKLGPMVYGDQERLQYLILVRPELFVAQTAFSASTSAACRASLVTWLPQLTAARDSELDAGWFCSRPAIPRERTR